VHGHWFYGFEHLIKGLSGGFLFFPRQGYHMHYHDIYTGLVWFGLAHDHTKAVSSTGVYLWACRFYLGVYGFGMVIANHWLGLRCYFELDWYSLQYGLDLLRYPRATKKLEGNTGCSGMDGWVGEWASFGRDNGGESKGKGMEREGCGCSAGWPLQDT